MQTHVQRSVARCFAVLHQLRSIRRDVPSSVYQSLVVALVLLRLDYGNATLAGCSQPAYNHLQSVLNTTDRSIAGLRRSKHITDALASFRWLWAPKRIKFKLAVTVYRAFHGTAPQYLSDRLQYVADLPTRRWDQSIISSVTNSEDYCRCIKVISQRFRRRSSFQSHRTMHDIVCMTE